MPTASEKLRRCRRLQPKPTKTQQLSHQFVEKQIDKLRGFVKQHKLREPSQAMPSGKLRIFADCAGLSSELIALAFLGFTSENMEFVGGSELDGTKRVLAQAVHKSFGLSTEKKALEHDIFDRNFSNTKASDLYISGFPCPAYSNCGQKLGAKDGQKRGLLVFEGLKYIAYWFWKTWWLSCIRNMLAHTR